MMNATKAILFCAMATIVAGCASFAPVDPDAVEAAIPGDTIHYHEGGAPWDPAEEMTLVLPEHQVRIDCYRDYDDMRRTNAMSRLDAIVSDDEWRWVAGQLAKSNVMNWSGSYPGAGYLDGTSWSMQFLRGSNVVQSASGSNNRSRSYREFRTIKLWAERKASWTEDGSLSLFRYRAVSEIELPVRKTEYRIRRFMYDRKPDYFLLGPFVFTTVSINYLVDVRPDFHDLIFEDRETPDEEFVVLSAVMPDAAAEGYLGMAEAHVRSVNGVKIRNLRHLVSVVEESRDEFLRFGLDTGDEWDKTMILDAAQMREAKLRVMERYAIPADRSADLR